MILTFEWLSLKFLFQVISNDNYDDSITSVYIIGTNMMITSFFRVLVFESADFKGVVAGFCGVVVFALKSLGATRDVEAYSKSFILMSLENKSTETLIEKKNNRSQMACGIWLQASIGLLLYNFGRTQSGFRKRFPRKLPLSVVYALSSRRFWQACFWLWPTRVRASAMEKQNNCSKPSFASESLWLVYNVPATSK